MIYLVCTTVLLVVIYAYLQRVYSRFSSHNVKHFKPLPIFGNALPILVGRMHLTEDMTRYYKEFPGERFVGKYEFMNSIIFIRDLDLVKKITIKDFDHFVDRRGFTDESIEPIFSKNLFSMTGNEWKDMRSTLSPVFTSSKIKMMVPFMLEVGNQMMDKLKKEIQANKGQTIEIDCKDLTCRYATDVIASCVFGLKVNSFSQGHTEFYERGKIVSELRLRQLVMFFVYNAFPTLVKFLKISPFSEDVSSFFKDIVMDTIKNREAHNIIRPDMIHLLMEAKKGCLQYDKKTPDENVGFAAVEESSIGKKTVNRNWTDNDLAAQALVFFLAGFETVSTTLSFTLRELSKNKEVQDRLVAVIKEDAQKNNGEIDFNSVQNIPYLDQVISEVLRLWPSVFQLDRVCTKPYNLGKPNEDCRKDYILKKGEQIIVPVWSIHRNPEYFANPDKFDPDRFSDERKELIKPMTYMPFGSGPRNCIGARFALCELKVLIYQLLLNMEVLPSEKNAEIPIIEKNSFTIKIEGGVWVNLKLRD